MDWLRWSDIGHWSVWRLDAKTILLSAQSVKTPAILKTNRRLTPSAGWANTGIPRTVVRRMGTEVSDDRGNGGVT